MASGLNIKDGVYIEEPARTRREMPILADRGLGFDGRNAWRTQSRLLSAQIQHDAIRRGGAEHAKFRCSWCGSRQTVQLNRETVSQGCPNCGGPR